MADEMYLQKGSQYHGGEYVGADEEGNLFKVSVAFMIVGLKKSIPYIIKASPEVTINGSWLSTEICSCISSLSKAGFNVLIIIQATLMYFPFSKRHIVHPHVNFT